MPPRAALVVAAAAALSCVTARAADPATGLQPGDRVAVCGDSITEQHQYSADIEAYLAMCRPTANVTTEQFGWGGETANGFFEKMPQFMLPFGNTVATTCYGMNDGRYAPLTQAVADGYRQKQTAIVDALKKAGYRLIVVGTPGAVDTYTFRNSPEKAVVYNKTLAALGDIDREVAKQEGVGFADVHGAMVDAMAKAKAKYGEKFAVAGPDGIHPNADGHLVMAYAYLKALNVTGDIGTITVDLKTQSATATDGHKVLGCTGGAVQVESTRYPYCFSGDPAKPDATTGMIQFIPFNDDLNRFRLVVTNAGAEQVKVTFGPSNKVYAAADLAKGVNLAADFLDNPFSKPFAETLKKIQAKQGIETLLDKNFYDSIPALAATFPQAKAAYEATQAPIRDCLAAQAKAVVEGVTPVRYTITVVPVR